MCIPLVPRVFFRSLSLVIALGLMSLEPAHAVDGVVEINFARSFVGAVTAGDTPDYPVTISEPGSYRLTGNLVNPSSDIDTIEITAAYVTLDLNGYTVRGPNVCTGSGGSVSCSTIGGGSGIRISGDFAVVRGGAVTGAANVGIIVTGAYASIDGVQADRNGFSGIGSAPSADGTSVRSSQAIGNKGQGLYLQTGALVVDSTTSLNFVEGVDVTGGSLVRGHVARGNYFSGIRVRSGAALVVESTTRNNTAYGIEGTSTTAIARNVIDDNVVGTVSGGGAQMGTNMCDGNTVCP